MFPIITLHVQRKIAFERSYAHIYAQLMATFQFQFIPNLFVFILFWSNFFSLVGVHRQIRLRF